MRVRNRSKLVEISLLAVIDLIQGARFILLYFIWRVGDDFHKKFKILGKNFFIMCYFISFFHVITAP